MLRLTVETNNLFNANVIASFLKNVKTVNKVVIEKPTSRKHLAKESPELYNWTNPKRPATDEEIDWMLDKCEAQFDAHLGVPLEKARAITKKRITEWKKKNMR